MSDETTAVDGALVAPVETPEAPEIKQEAAPESTTEQQGEPAERDEQGRFKAKKDAQDRINELTRRWRETERVLEAERAHREALERQYTQPKVSDQPPMLEDFNYDQAEYSRALTAYAVKQATSAVESKYQQQESQRTQQEMFESYGKRERDYAAKNPDYADAVSDLGRVVRFAPAVIEAIGSMDAGPAVLHHLAKNLDEADRIARMAPHIAALHLGRMERDLATKPKPVSNAPAPAPTVGGAAVVKKSPDAMPIDEWLRWRNEQLKANR